VLVTLTAVSACADVLSYRGLGHVFQANMTGNTVLLGIGAAAGDSAAAIRSATALLAFLLGAAASGLAVPGRASPRALATCLGAETAIMAAFSGGWWAAPADGPRGALRIALIVLAGLSMGLQSGVVRASGIPVATTYITGTWTALSAATAARIRGRRGTAGPPGPPLALQAAIVVTYLAAAAGATLADVHIHRLAPVVPVALLAATATTTAVRSRLRRRPPELRRAG
jgi:uncharacterized membrane protein YoaK (UPF0700 family)